MTEILVRIAKPYSSLPGGEIRLELNSGLKRHGSSVFLLFGGTGRLPRPGIQETKSNSRLSLAVDWNSPQVSAPLNTGSSRSSG